MLPHPAQIVQEHEPNEVRDGLVLALTGDMSVSATGTTPEDNASTAGHCSIGKSGGRGLRIAKAAGTCRRRASDSVWQLYPQLLSTIPDGLPEDL